MEFWEHIRKSVQFDILTLKVTDLSRQERISLIMKKYLQLLKLMTKRDSRMTIRTLTLSFHNLSELGTFQSCLVDLHDELVASGLLVDAPYVIDVGANVGQWSGSLLILRPHAKVLAIEADPETFDALQSNLCSNKDVEFVNCAISDTIGEANFYRQPLLGMSTLLPTEDDDITNAISVQVTTLDEVMLGKPDPDLVKIDIEGAELNAVRGARQTLGRTKILVIELSLSRGASNAIAVLEEVRKIAPAARIIKFGRPLGKSGLPSCQDVVVRLV